MSISKEQWEQIERDLTGFTRIEFISGDLKVSVSRKRVSENKLGLVVYLNGEIDLGLISVKESEHNDDIKKFWRRRSRAVYSAADKARIIKAFGKREAKKSFNLDRASIWYEPVFPTTKALIRQFKKIDGLELAIG